MHVGHKGLCVPQGLLSCYPYALQVSEWGTWRLDSVHASTQHVLQPDSVCKCTVTRTQHTAESQECTHQGIQPTTICRHLVRYLRHRWAAGCVHAYTRSIRYCPLPPVHLTPPFCRSLAQCRFKPGTSRTGFRCLSTDPPWQICGGSVVVGVRHDCTKSPWNRGGIMYLVT